jgi:hypothetical protein
MANSLALQSKLGVVACCVVAVATCGVNANELLPKDAQNIIDGIYVLEEWRTDAGTFRPPVVEGRFVLLNGRVVYSVQNRINEASQLSSLGYGRYELKPANFSYSYDTWSVFTKGASGITESQKLPWEGSRSFDAVAEPHGVALRASTGEEFRFTKDGVTVLSKGKVLRVWRRVPPP